MSVEDLNDALRDETDESEAEGGKKNFVTGPPFIPGDGIGSLFITCCTVLAVSGGGGSFFSLASAIYVY